jgi:hypothetical protein
MLILTVAGLLMVMFCIRSTRTNRCNNVMTDETSVHNYFRLIIAIIMRMVYRNAGPRILCKTFRTKNLLGQIFFPAHSSLHHHDIVFQSRQKGFHCILYTSLVTIRLCSNTTYRAENKFGIFTLVVVLTRSSLCRFYVSELS